MLCNKLHGLLRDQLFDCMGFRQLRATGCAIHLGVRLTVALSAYRIRGEPR
ncbi:unnamed protein product [Mycetohabitans rhizoxinica HKI 454]|uniref:Uncharacterized protein n=1 Tax=Mycetohabitans rhizoxinica (strain DSM 19002 / CIP 109453 / HKI 454) TaxID=882378 RepID=E5AKC1_MYCRK|nr:unnamed protein product [Mycetohabitans rhizoxinica HKI 454]